MLPAAANQPEEEHQRGENKHIGKQQQAQHQRQHMDAPSLLNRCGVEAVRVVLHGHIAVLAWHLHRHVMVGQEWYSGFAALAA